VEASSIHVDVSSGLIGKCLSEHHGKIPRHQ